tara:strand:- start:1385 stop:1585 length:201 start_codon:yes stop_codon:yes gene_type:complete
MIMYQIDYIKIIENYNTVINTLEYDSMRSGGKAKLNCQALEAMYSMKERYEKLISKPKPTPTKEVK